MAKKDIEGQWSFPSSVVVAGLLRLIIREVTFAQESKRQSVSLAISLAFFISRHDYAGYRKTLGRGLGLEII